MEFDLLQGNLNNQKDSRSLKPVKTRSNNIEPLRLFSGYDMLGRRQITNGFDMHTLGQRQISNGFDMLAQRHPNLLGGDHMNRTKKVATNSLLTWDETEFSFWLGKHSGKQGKNEIK